MPTYEYGCDGCGHRFESFQGITEDPVKVCPECGGTVKRLISQGASFILKGRGFYATDYKRTQPDCGRENTCCGRDTPCEKKPCE